MQHRRSPEQAAQQATRQDRESALEAEATQLLRDHAQRYTPREYPFYMPSSLRQMSYRDELISHRHLQADEAAGTTPALLLEGLASQIELSALNRAVLELTRQGLRAAQVALALGLTPKAVHRRLDRIIARLRHAAQAGGGFDRLIQETCAEQAKPNRYQPEQHCRPGQEACRRDGRCRFRWYLYAITAEQEGE